ncbi:MAG: MerR family transcriptional regulator [Acidimicrobiales bacterium]
MAVVETSFTGRRAVEIVGITYRQLDYWARTDLVRPSLADAAGSGSRRAYSYTDLLKLRVIKALLDAGIRLETVRQVFTYIEDELGQDVESANLVIHGSTPVLARSGEELIDLVQRGQGVLNVLPLAGIRDEVEARIIEFPLGGGSTPGSTAASAGVSTADDDPGSPADDAVSR